MYTLWRKACTIAVVVDRVVLEEVDINIEEGIEYPVVAETRSINSVTIAVDVVWT